MFLGLAKSEGTTIVAGKTDVTFRLQDGKLVKK
jgi:hypothetical protein